MTIVVGLAAVLVGVGLAASRAWMADDAYISLRYAGNLARGLGLVYNAGERVEGFTNLLWTLLLALALRLGLDGEQVALIGGVAAFAGSLLWLLRAHLRDRSALGSRGATVPLGLLLLALSPSVLDFATSGLETALFTFLLLMGISFTQEGRPGRAGLLLALATTTRPDGALVAGIAALFLLRRDWRGALRLGLGAGLILLPVTLVRWGYYGSLLPNTYFAKSGGESWWGQGLVYLQLQLKEQPWLLLLPLALRAAPLPAVAALAYGLYVVKVGGDFMVGRLFVPTAAMGAMALDRLSLQLQAAHRAAVGGAILLIAVCAVLPPNLEAGATRSGIIQERPFYGLEFVERNERDTATLRHYTDGLPLTVAIGGGQARMAYRADWPVVIESSAGLTDAWTAHQHLSARGRVGHEKKPTLGYLLLRRHVDLTFSPLIEQDLALDKHIPLVEADLGGVWARLLRWTFPIADALKARGGRLTNYPRMLADDGARMAELDEEDARDLYLRHWLFYFAHTDDPTREAPFRARLPDFDPSPAAPP